MIFEVRWNRQATGQLATIWTESSNRNGITASVLSIDRILREQPGDQGESRENENRIFAVPPLVVEFRISEQDRLVEVLAVRHLTRRP